MLHLVLEILWALRSRCFPGSPDLLSTGDGVVYLLQVEIKQGSGAEQTAGVMGEPGTLRREEA